MFKATYNLTFGANKVGDTQANGIPGQHISRMPNTKVSMRSGGRNILQIQGRPRSLDSGYPPDYNAKPRPFLGPNGGDSSDNKRVRPVLPLTQSSGDQGGAAFNKCPRPFHKPGDDGQTPRATSYPSYPTQKKLGDPGRSYLPERKNVCSGASQQTWGQKERRLGPPVGSSMDHLGSDLNLQGIRGRSTEKSPGPDMMQQPPQSPLNRESSSGSPKPPWSPSARETTPVRPQPPKSPRRREPSPGSPKPPWSPAERVPRERSPKKEQPWAKSSPSRDTKEPSPTKDPPWSKPREPSPKQAQSSRSKYGRGTSPAKENRPPLSAGSRDSKDKSPSKDPRPPWSAGARDVSPKDRRLSAGRGLSPGKEHGSVVRDPGPGGKRPQWPNDPRDPSPSKEQQRSPGGRGLSPKKDKQQWSPGGRGTSPGKEQRPPWSPGGRVTSPVKDVRPPWMIQPQVKDHRVDNKPRSRGTSPSKDYKPPWAQPSRDRSPGLGVPVSHQPPKSPRTRGQSPARSNQVRDFRGQSPARQDKPQWSYPGERDNSPQELKKRSQSGREQSPAHLPPVGLSSPRMSRPQRTKDFQPERSRRSPQIVSSKRSPPQMSYYGHDEHNGKDRKISPQRATQTYTHPPERASYIMQETEHTSRGQPQYSSDEKPTDEQPRRGRERSRREPPGSPRIAKKDIRQLLIDESNLDDSLSERDDEVERILSGILDTTAMSRKERKSGVQSQEQLRGQGQGHAFEPYGRQDSSDSKSSQPHSNFYQSLQVRPGAGQTSRQHVPSSQQNNSPPSASGPKKVLLKSSSNPDPLSFASVDDQVAPSSPKEPQQSPRTRRSAFARSKPFQPEITSDHEVSDTAVAERKRSLEMQIKSSQSFDSMPLSAHQSEGDNALPRVPKAFKPGAVTFINGVPCEAKTTPVKSPRVRRHADQQLRQRTKSLDSEVYYEQVRGLESGEESYQSDSKLSVSHDHLRGNAQEQSDNNRYSGAYDNVQGADYKAPPMAGDNTDGGHHGFVVPPVASDDTESAQRQSEALGNPAVFVEQSYGDLRDEEGNEDSFSLLQPPEEALLRTSPSVREMAMERESAEAAFQQEEQHVRKKKPYSSRKMSMPVESRTEKMIVRKMSLEAPPDMPSGSDTDERPSRATAIQPHVQDLMAFRMRASKFRHVFGEASKKDKSYENVRITKNQHDSMFCAVNPKFLAVVVESAGGGAFLVLPIKQVGRIDINAPKVCGHAGAVLDIKWSPFNDHQIASCSDDATIKVWEIPEDGLQENLTEWIVDLHGHQRRIGYIEWHPTAEHILLSAGFDFNVIIWNIETAEPINIITCHTDTIFSISWNRDGSLFATTSKDKKIRVIDPRSGSVISEGSGHVGPKSSKVVFLGDSQRLFTTGFSRMSERQFGIWDANDLSKPLRLECIDSSSGVLLPYYDVDNRVMFLVGKGDGNIRYYEIVEEAPYCHFLSAYLSGQPQKGFGVMPKRGVDLTKCEIVRFYKLLSSKPLIEPISMRVPRKSEMFQEDIFPPTASSIPSLSAMEWINGQNRDPILVSLKDGAMQPTNTPTITTYKAVSRSLLNNNDTAPPQEPTEPKHIPASVQNIKKLSISGDQIPNLDELLDGKILYEDDPKRKRESVHERISAFETKAEPIRPSPPPMLSNTTRQVSIEKKTPPPSHWMSEIPPNGLPKTDGEAIATTPEDVEMTTPEKKVHVKKVWTPKSPQAEEPPMENGLTPKTDPELRKAYFRQLEEIHSLKEQITLKDKRIHQLEEELADLKDCEGDDTPSQSNC